MNETILILGATSGIARPLCQLLAARGCRLILAGRNENELAKQAADLRIRHQTEVDVVPLDALDFDSHAAFFARCLQTCDERLDGAILCYGYLPDQAATQTDFAAARYTLDVNFTSAVSLLNLAANYLEKRRAGYLAVIGSVAGDRGRQSNYTYGAAKAGLAAYLQGLRNRLFHAGVHVLTIKPGFVATAMTAGRVNPNSPLVASPERVARDIERAIRKRKNVVYTPWFWRIILTIVCALPEAIFKRLKM